MPSQSAFDAYHKWLGIPPKDQPPNHYRLLAIELFESDVEVIEAAANRQMAYVQQRATGEHAAISQKLLNELSAARVCLLDFRKRVAYDAAIKKTTSSLPAANPPPAIEPQGIERLLAEERDEVFHQAQQAYAFQDYEKVVELLKTQPVDGNNPQFQQLLKSARFSLDEIQRLSQELDLAWKQKDAKRVSQVATELLSIQPSHLAANEAIRWALAANRHRRKSRWSLIPGGWKLRSEPILSKHLVLTALVLLAAIVLGSVIVMAIANGGRDEQEIAKAPPTTIIESKPLAKDGKAQTAKEPEKLYLADLKPAVRNVLGPPEGIQRMRIRNATPLHGLQAHPRSNSFSLISFRIPKAYRYLSGTVGIASVNGEGHLPRGGCATPLVFRIEGDGKSLWKSRPLQKANDMEPFSIKLGGTTIDLYVDCPGNYSWAWALWIDPVLTQSELPKPKPILVQDQKPSPEVAAPKVDSNLRWLPLADTEEQFKHNWRQGDDVRGRGNVIFDATNKTINIESAWNLGGLTCRRKWKEFYCEIDVSSLCVGKFDLVIKGASFKLGDALGTLPARASLRVRLGESGNAIVLLNGVRMRPTGILDSKWMDYFDCMFTSECDQTAKLQIKNVHLLVYGNDTELLSDWTPPEPNSPESADALKESEPPWRLTGGWTVIFRSKDPSIWNTNTNNGPNRYAVPLSTLPEDIRFLRMQIDHGKHVILAIRKDQLGGRYETKGFGWNGRNGFAGGAHKLGICNKQWDAKKKGSVVTSALAGQRLRGWGFGVRYQYGDKQGYTWAGQEIPPTVFEISVRSTALPEKAETFLLK